MTSEAADILVVNWNGAFFLRHFLPLALEVTSPSHRFSIWDNGSVDGSQALLMDLGRRHRGRITPHFTRGNRGHAGGLERLLERTDRDLLVFLDCDAVPLRAGWLEALAAPVLSGAAGYGIWFAHYLHPACLCTRRSTLRALGVDVHPDYPKQRDVLQHLTQRAEAEGLDLVRLPEDGGYLFDGFGQTYGNQLVYHHWFGTRVNPFRGMAVTPEGRTSAGLERSKRSLEAWMRERSLWREGSSPARPRALWYQLLARSRAVS